MTNKLLCATDGSHPSDHAVALAVDMAKRMQIPLSFLTVNRASQERTSKTHFWDDRVIDAVDAQINKVLADAAAAAKQAGLGDVRCVTAAGTNIAAAIVDYAEKNGFDHIVVGSRHPSEASRVLLGSVASDVVKKAHCAVTIAR